jgi:hypothetical protein
LLPSSRTQGNPFFLTQLLKNYHDSGLMRFGFAASQWTWDLQAMHHAAVQADVCDLVCSRMRELGADAQLLLQYAACSGNRVTLHMLHLITQLPIGSVAAFACLLPPMRCQMSSLRSSPLVVAISFCAAFVVTSSRPRTLSLSRAAAAHVQQQMSIARLTSSLCACSTVHPSPRCSKHRAAAIDRQLPRASERRRAERRSANRE